MNSSFASVIHFEPAALVAAKEDRAAGLWITVSAVFSPHIVQNGYAKVTNNAFGIDITLTKDPKAATHIPEDQMQRVIDRATQMFGLQRVKIRHHVIDEDVLNGHPARIQYEVYPDSPASAKAAMSRSRGSKGGTSWTDVQDTLKEIKAQAQYVLFVVSVSEEGFALDTGFFALNDHLIAKHSIHLDKDVHNAMPVNMEEAAILKQYILSFNERAEVTMVPKPAPLGHEATPRFEEMRALIANMKNQSK